MDEESAPCAFVESFLKKLHLEEYVENFEQKYRHPVHLESRFSKKMHLEESPENFGRTNCILYTRSLFLEEQAPGGAYGRGRKKIRIICIWKICRRLSCFKPTLHHQTWESQLRGPEPREDTEGNSRSRYTQLRIQHES